MPRDGDIAILTMATGSPKYLTMAKALALTLDMNFVNCPRAIVSDNADAETRRLYDLVIPTSEKYPYWFSKFCALEMTSFDRVLFIDADCLVVKNIEPLLEAVRGSDFAVQGSWTTGTEWYGDFASAMKGRGLARAPVMNGGLIYYERTAKGQQMIDRVMQNSQTYGETGLKTNRGHAVDEVCVSLAMAQSGIGKVLPDSGQFSFTPWRLMSNVHLDVMRGDCSFVKWLDGPRIVKPLIYHSAHTNSDVRYWRAVKRVMRLNSCGLGRASTYTDRTVALRKIRKALTMLFWSRPDKW